MLLSLNLLLLLLREKLGRLVQSKVQDLTLKTMADFVREKSLSVKMSKEKRDGKQQKLISDKEQSSSQLEELSVEGEDKTSKPVPIPGIEIEGENNTGKPVEEIDEYVDTTVIHLLNSPFSNSDAGAFRKELLEYQKHPIAGSFR